MLGGGHLHIHSEFYNASETMNAVNSPEQCILQKQAYRENQAPAFLASSNPFCSTDSEFAAGQEDCCLAITEYG